MMEIIKYYIIIIGTMKNNYLYNVILRSKQKIKRKELKLENKNFGSFFIIKIKFEKGTQL